MPSLYSCGSSYGSETSIPAAAHTVSNAPVTEYMWVSQQEGCTVLVQVASLSFLLLQALKAHTFGQAVESDEGFCPQCQKTYLLIGIYWDKGIA